MDGKRFDSLTRALGSGRSRRGLLRAFGAAALGAAGMGRLGMAQAAPGGNSDCAHYCNEIFPPGKDRGQCKSEAARGTGACFACGGPRFAGEGENCEAGVVTDCDPDGFCACVDDVDGNAACVARICSFISCTTGADCESGLCISAPGCCGDPNPFCGTPCDAAGASVAARSAGGWR